MASNKKYKLVILILLIAGFCLLSYRYFSQHSIAVLSPKGPVAGKERNLIVFTLLLCLVVVIPVYTLLFAFAWKYRASNVSAKYSPNLDHNAWAETTWWLIPTALISVLAVIAWRSSHQLDPFRPLDSAVKPMTIQVVAMDWKWLFIYPQQNLASVNYVKFPVNTPLNFEITSDAPMNSFWIPQLGGQIYAMPGMTTQLHLMASQAGNFRGSSANISGRGFAGMDFTASATSNSEFNHWVTNARLTAKPLNLNEYNQLAKPSSNNPVAYYSSAGPGLFANVDMRYMTPGMENYVQ